MLNKQLELVSSRCPPSIVVLFFADGEPAFVLLKFSGSLGSGQAFGLARKHACGMKPDVSRSLATSALLLANKNMEAFFFSFFPPSSIIVLLPGHWLGGAQELGSLLIFC